MAVWHPLGGNGGFPSDMVTSDIVNDRRLKVDNDQETKDILLSIDETVKDIFALNFLDALQVQISSSINAPDERTFLLLTNNSTTAISIDQVVNAEALSTGTSEGTSVISVLAYFNPDTTGSTSFVSDTVAYANGYDGKFVNVTGSGILLSVLEDFDLNLNTDVVRLVGGQVAYFTSAQGLTSSALNGQVNLANPLTVASGESMVLSFVNTPLVDGGTEVLTTALISGKFLSIDGRVEVLPPSLIDESGIDNLITEDGDNLVGESW